MKIYKDRKYFKYFNIYDLILILILLFVPVAISIIIAITAKRGNNVNIVINDTMYGSYPLDEDRVIELSSYDNGINIVVIENGYVYMKDANCKDKLCIYQGRINNCNETICCLPNKVLISIGGDDSLGEYDAITQ